MKMKREDINKDINLPVKEVEALETSDIEGIEIAGLEGAILAMKSNMTVMELIKVAQGLKNLSKELILHLAETCGRCEDCSYCERYEDYDEIIVPDYLLEEAGIPTDAKLCACTEEDSGEIIIIQADYDYDISDIPQFVIDIFEESGLCIRELEERLLMGDIVYGEE